MRELELDLMGKIYACQLSPAHLGTFSIRVNLVDPVEPPALQVAVDDLMRRLPFLCARLRMAGGAHLELLEDPPIITPDSIQPGTSPFTAFYRRGRGHSLVVRHGPRHILVEGMHTITDGRGLLQFTRALVVRYFEGLGFAPAHGDIVDCGVAPTSEESADAYRVLSPDDAIGLPGAGDRKPAPTDPKRRGRLPKRPPRAYKHKPHPPVPTWVTSQELDLARVRNAAKRQDLTVSEYLLERIFRAIAAERDDSANFQPIVAIIPVDLRRFYPTETLRNFVADINVTMPETIDSTEFDRQLAAQFAKTDAAWASKTLTTMKAAYRLDRLPQALRAALVRWVANSSNRRTTTMFSNLGLARLPGELADRIESMEFLISPTGGLPYTFSAIGYRDTLTLSATSDVTDTGLVAAVFDSV